MKPRLFVEQKITAFANVYRVFTASENGDQDQLEALAQQKRLAFKEKVSFYTDESKKMIAFTFRAEKILDVHGTYLVEDKSGKVIGMFKKEFKQSLLNSTWKVMDAKGDKLFTVQESSMALAIIRRCAGFIPIIGDLVELITYFLKYHFVFIDNGKEVGRYQKTTLFRDHYTLSMTDNAYNKSDWRVIAALGVGLDALQSR